MRTTIRQAQPNDEATVSAILTEAAAWLSARNMSLWQAGELGAESIAADVAAGLYYLADCDGVAAGTLRFQMSDILFWPDVPQDEAAYIHRLAVRRQFAGGCVSQQLLEWAADRAAGLGCKFLRLDCDTARGKLRAVYEKFGFRYHSDRQVGPYLVARYELPVKGRVTASILDAPGSPIVVSKYSFSEYSPAWQVEFAAEADRLRKLLGNELLDVHHIGSTSVPGLAAKPVIDLIPVVGRIEFMDQPPPAFVAAGYRAWGEYGIPSRRFFTKDRAGNRTHNLHFFAPGSPHIERHLAFRDFLRSHPEVCREYEALKREVFARHPAEIDAYCDGKDAWIQGVESLAVQWYREQRL